MKRSVLLILSLLYLVPAMAQQPTIQQITSQISKRRISLDYSYSQGGAKVDGHFSMSGFSFIITAGTNRIICDGKSRWTVDEKTKEVYIEPAGKLPSWMKNPQALKNAVSGVANKDNTITGVFTNPEDKKKYNFTLYNVDLNGPATGNFSFDTSKLDKSWVVTDLR